MVINFSTTTTLFVFMTGISAQPKKSEYSQMLSMICKFFYFVTTIAEGRADAFYFVTTEERCLPSCIFQIASDKRFNALDSIFQRNTFKYVYIQSKDFGFQDIYLKMPFLKMFIFKESIWFQTLSSNWRHAE